MKPDQKVIDQIIFLTNWGYQIKEISEDQCIPFQQVSKIIDEARNLGRIEKKV
jgi:hypothetical protein